MYNLYDFEVTTVVLYKRIRICFVERDMRCSMVRCGMVRWEGPWRAHPEASRPPEGPAIQRE